MRHARAGDDRVRPAKRLQSRAISRPSFCFLQSSIEPCFRGTPIAAHSHQRNLQHVSRFFETETSEVTKFDDTTFALVEFSQLVESLFQRDELSGAFYGHRRGLFDRNLSCSTSMLGVTPPPRMIDKNVTHHAGGYGKEVRPVLPNHFLIG